MISNSNPAGSTAELRLENIPAIIFETDLNLNILYINSTGRAVLRLSELPNKGGCSLLEFVHRDDRPVLRDYCSRLAGGGPGNIIVFRISGGDKTLTAILCKAALTSGSTVIRSILWNAMDLREIADFITIPAESFFIVYKLSPREREVLKLMLTGYKTREIARTLFITESTVKNHISAIYSAVGVKNKDGLFNVLKDYQASKFGRESFVFSALSSLLKD